MRILSFDPGAKRCGWAVLDSGFSDNYPRLVASGIYGIDRDPKVTYQDHRLRLIKYWISVTIELLDKYKPDDVVNETVPSPKGDNFGRLAQMNLAATVVTVIQTVALCDIIPVTQIGATTVKKEIGGNGKASKVKVRNGVYTYLPETKGNPEWSKVFDESDAIAVGLTYLKLLGL